MNRILRSPVGRAWALLLLLAALLAAGNWWSNRPVSRLEHQQRMRDAELQQRFALAVSQLNAKQYQGAMTTLHRVLELSPKMPEAHVNMGYALLGMQQPEAAQGFFLSAIELRPQQANAYWGLAITHEQRQDYEAALGAMRSFLHLSRADDPYRSRARAALWEWEEKLGRHVVAGTPARPR